MATSQPCATEGCRGIAKGGHRYCYACIGQLLSQPTERPKPIRETTITYQPRKKQRGR